MSDLADTLALSHTDYSQFCQGDTSSREDCGEDAGDEDYFTRDTLKMIVAVSAMFLLAQPILLLFIKHQKKQSQNQEETNVNDTTKEDERINVEQPLLDHDRIYLEDASVAVIGDNRKEKDSIVTAESIPTALMLNLYVPELVRHLIPMLIVAIIALLLSSNLGVGATVDLVVSIDDEVVRLPSLFSFSLVNTASEMWNAGIYPLFLLVVVFSGVWPYVKLILMLFSWTVRPMSALQTRRRGRLLLALDALGKFSLVDTYVLVCK